MKRLIVARLLYGVVGLAFAYAGVVKILDPEHFLSSILTYEIFSYGKAVAIALTVPWLEVLVALSLVFGFWRKGASLICGVMLMVFVILVVQAGLRGLSIDCGCYGSNRLESGFDYVIKVAQNVGLLAMLGVAVFLGREKSSGKKFI